MSRKSSESKVSVWLPIVLAAASGLIAFGSLEQRVSANEDNINILKTDHDTLIEVRQVVCGLSDFLKSPTKCRLNR